jgi:hypothetical protein
VATTYFQGRLSDKFIDIIKKSGLSAILSGFSEVIAIEPLLLRKNREDIEYGTQELRNSGMNGVRLSLFSRLLDETA